MTAASHRLTVCMLMLFFSLATQPCQVGYFGRLCKMLCHCDGGIVNCQQGNCTQGCEKMYIGPYCQYKAYYPSAGVGTGWLTDGNINTCNTGVSPPVTAKSALRTAITYMRVTFRNTGQLFHTSFDLHGVSGGSNITMTCSKKLSVQVDKDGKVFDIPCFSKQIVDSIDFGGRGALHLCEVLLSPGRNIAHVLTPSEANGLTIHEIVDGFTFDGQNSTATCAHLYSREVRFFLSHPSEINLILLFNGPRIYASNAMQDFDISVMTNNITAVVYQRRSPSYDYSILIVLPDRKLNASLVTVTNTKASATDYFLCDVKILGEFHCCHNIRHDGCLTTEAASPICHKREIKACQAGYRGDFCEEDCPEGFYGHDCIQRCSGRCKDGKCDNAHGHCHNCYPGYRGDQCDEDCEAGYYGQGCIQPCNDQCRGGICDKVDGRCFPCNPGYRGDRCEKDCPEGYYGQDCAKTCSNRCKGGNCDNVYGHCHSCFPGYRGDLCDEDCEDGYYGQDCTQKCSDQCKDGKCSKIAGHCYACNPGYRGDRCDKECGTAQYGPDCSLRCSPYCQPAKHHICHLVSGDCLRGCQNGRAGNKCQYSGCSPHCKGGSSNCAPHFGNCLEGCKPGYRGLYCYQACVPGTYGDNCANTCSPFCKNKTCNGTTGHCLSGCLDGVQKTPRCDIPCARGTYGHECSQSCNSNCRDGVCEAGNGTCSKGCKTGYRMPFCNLTCTPTFYGSNCEQKCSPSCDQNLCDIMTGHCSTCKPGAIGPSCRKACPAGMYGAGCAFFCKDNCNGQTTCETTTGLCTQCPAGKHGAACNSNCELGKYGRNCNKFCSPNCLKGSCSSVNGSCDKGCIDNWDRPFCTKCRKSWHGEACDKPCSVFCDHQECEPTSGRCYFCVLGRRGDWCQEISIINHKENYMIAGLLATGLLLFVLAMICCIAEVVYEGDKKDKGESFRRTESFPEKYFSEASTVFQTTARSTVESSVWSRSSEGTSVDFIEDDDDDDDDEDDDLESEVDEEEEEGLSGSRIFRNLKAFTERMKATPLK